MAVKASISLFNVDEMIRSAGAERVGEDASRKLREILEDSAEAIVFKAKIIARHANRNDITRADILLAAGVY